MAFLIARVRHNLLTRALLRFVLGVVFIYIYCEYLIYYVTQIQVSEGLWLCPLFNSAYLTNDIGYLFKLAVAENIIDNEF